MNDLIREKAYNFALRIVRLCEYLNNEKREYVLSRKLADSGVNISLLVEEGRQGDNRTEFVQKYSVANKEAFKSHTLLRLLRDTEYLTPQQAESILADCDELKKLLISSLKTARRKDQ